LEPAVTAWNRLRKQNRVPHALLLAGRPGIGKRALAAWLAARHLSGQKAPEAPGYPWTIPEHADLRWLQPPPDKQTIGVEQVRELVSELSLTSYEGTGKAAVIEPANAMTDSAANSLLKTLEEPPGNALLILVTDRVGRLPPTIFSRCQRLGVPLPAESAALAWLERVEPGDAAEWQAVLPLADGAPLAAVELRERIDDARQISSELLELAGSGRSPVQIATRWAELDPRFVLNHLARQVQDMLRQALSAGPGADFPESVMRRIDSRNLFCYLDIINELRAQAPGSFNVALTFESLLIEWSTGLKNCRAANGPGELLPGTATG